MVFLWEDKEENASKDRRTLLPIVRIKMGPNKNANRQIKNRFHKYSWRENQRDNGAEKENFR